MSKKALVIGGAVALVAVVSILTVVMWVVGTFNGEMRISNRFEAQEKVVEVQLDNMVKTLRNKYGVSEKYAKDFIAAVQAQTEGRSGGSVFKATAESEALGITSDIYMDMAASISGEMDAFSRQQNVLQDVWREHKTYCQTIPRSLLVSGRVKEQPEVISSSEVKEAVETGELDNNLLNPGE